jgi:hypothetical protein
MQRKVNFEALKHQTSSHFRSENDHVYLFKGIIIIHHIHKVGGKVSECSILTVFE